jgi:hypothetical protein
MITGGGSRTSPACGQPTGRATSLLHRPPWLDTDQPTSDRSSWLWPQHLNSKAKRRKNTFFVYHGIFTIVTYIFNLHTPFKAKWLRRKSCLKQPSTDK